MVLRRSDIDGLDPDESAGLRRSGAAEPDLDRGARAARYRGIPSGARSVRGADLEELHCDVREPSEQSRVPYQTRYRSV